MIISLYILFLVTGVYFYFSIKNFNFFSLKETFFIGNFLYIYIPLIFIFTSQHFLEYELSVAYTHDEKTMIKIILNQILTLLFIILGYRITKIKQNNNLFKKYKTIKFDEIILTLLLVFIISLFFPTIKTYLIFFIFLIIIIHDLKINKNIKIFCMFLLMLLFMHLQSYQAARREILYYVFIFLFLVSYEKKYFFSIKNFLLLLTLPIIAIYFIFKVTLTRTSYVNKEVDIFEWAFDSGIKVFLRNYDFMPAFDNYFYIVKNNLILYGQTIFKLFYSFVPRMLWDNKPLDTNTLIIKIRDNPFVGGQSAAVSFSGEIYWNYSVIGIIVTSFILGILFKCADKKLDIYNRAHKILICFSLPIFFIIWRGSITTSMINFIINIFVVCACLAFSRMIFERTKKLK